MGTAGTHRARALTFMAECFWPGITERDLVTAGSRARRAAEAMPSDLGPVRYLGSILVPADEIALCLFEAPSLGAASELNRRAAIPSERILEILRLDHSSLLSPTHEPAARPHTRQEEPA